MKISVIFLIGSFFLFANTALADLDLKKFISDDGTKLNVLDSSVSDDDLAQLKDSQFQNIKHLLLSSPNISNKGMLYLKHLRLENLTLHYSRVNDTGLEHIKNLPLKAISLYGSTEISVDGIAALKKVNPSIKVDQGPE